MIHEPLPDKKKVFKQLREYKLNMKAPGMQMKAQKQQSTAHNSKNDRWTIAEYDKSHQHIAGTQGKYEKTKSANTSAKPPKYYAQCENATWTIAGYDKSHQNIAGTQGNYEKTKNAEENAKATKYCAQQQKW